jgi:dTDP-glucose 4,6-dehydratase
MQETILILGSAGFIGANLIRYILYNHRNYKIVSIDNIEKDELSLNSIYVNKSHEFYVGDIDSRTMDILLKIHRPAYIINLTSSNEMIENVFKLDNFFKRLIKEQNIIKKFIQLSPYTVYADKQNVIEVSSLKYDNRQDMSKIFLEKIVGSRASEMDFKFNVIRHDELFGPRKKRGLVCNLYREFITTDKVLLANSGMIKRNLMHIEDLCAAIMIVLENGVETVYNASSGSDFIDLEIAQMIKECLDGNRLIEFSNLMVNSNYIELDTSKIKTLGWKSKKFKERLKQTIGWYQANGWFFR